MTDKICVLCGNSYHASTSSKVCPPCRTYTTKCEFCQIEFTRKIFPARIQKHGYPRFCSPTCRNKARQLELIPCPICGTLFKPNVMETDGTRKQSCSQRCGNISRRGKPSAKRTPKHIRDAVRNRYPIEGPDLLAQEFSLSIGAIRQIAYKQRVRVSNGRRWSNEKDINPPRAFTCKTCGQVFYHILYPSRQPPQYCSHKCRRNKVQITCRFCGKIVTIHKSREKIRQFCSHDCHTEFQKKRIGATCKNCGKQFEMPKSRYVRNRTGTFYCSKKCRAKYKTRTYYGANWNEQRNKALKRDNYTCQIIDCNNTIMLQVHHKQSILSFEGDWKTANVLSNLLTLCAVHHRMIETGTLEYSQLPT